MGQRRSGALRRPGLAALLVLAVGMVVSLAAGDGGLFTAAATPGDAQRLLIRVAGITAAVAGVGVLVLLRRRMPPLPPRAPEPSAVALGAAAVIMAALTVTWMLATPQPEDARMQFMANPTDDGVLHEREAEESPSVRRGPPRPPRSLLPITAPGGGGRARGSGVVPPFPFVDAAEAGDGRDGWRRVALALAALLLLAAAALTARMLSRAQPQAAPPLPVSRAAAVAAFEASLLDIRYEGTDPRKRISAAYHRLLTAIAEAGAPRQPQEAPHEYLHRSLAPLGVEAEPMHTLAELYVLAQFSRRDVGDDHAHAASAALEVSLHSLRAAAALAESSA